MEARCSVLLLQCQAIPCLSAKVVLKASLPHLLACHHMLCRAGLVCAKQDWQVWITCYSKKSKFWFSSAAFFFLEVVGSSSVFSFWLFLSLCPVAFRDAVWPHIFVLVGAFSFQRTWLLNNLCLNVVGVKISVALKPQQMCVIVVISEVAVGRWPLMLLPL